MAADTTLARGLGGASALALVYFVAGRLALLLAVPPGYASAVWPAAGIAFAMVFLRGRTMLAGTWLGSFLVNATVACPGTSSIERLLVASVIATGALAQAASATELARRLAGHGNPLDRAGSLVPLLAVGGPVGCLVNATVATGALSAIGLVAPGDAGYHWLTWWVGDTVGVVVATPLVLTWVAMPRAVWRARRWSVAAPLAIAFAAAVVLNADTLSREEARRQSAFEARAHDLAATLAHEADELAAMLRGVVGLYAASEVVTREEFGVYARVVLERAPGIRGLAWAPLLAAEGRERVPVDYVEPVAGNEAAIGLDLASEPRRREAVDLARTLRAPAATAPLTLVQEPAGQRGFLIVAPVERSGQVRGFVVAVVHASDFVDRVLPPGERPGIALRISDEGTGEPLVDHDVLGRRAWATVVPFSGRSLRVEATTASYGDRSPLAWIVLVGGLLLVGLLGTLVLELVTRAVQVEVLVTARTAELARANEALHHSNLELQRFAYVASHDMREPLRVVTTYAELVAEEAGAQLTAETSRRLARIVENARRMQTLVTDLLDLSRVEGHAEPFRPADLGALANAALEDLRGTVASSCARVTVGPLPTVACDAVQMVALFQNLFSNALKFRREGVSPEISVEARRAGDVWEIAVRDNGIGIPEEHRERVFEMFRRLHARERYPGTGIGLAVCKRVVERHGGRIWVDPAPGPGTTIRFTLPVAPEVS
ncbi:MAG: CHASE domain-containing protein [Myxococcota bacterium]